MQEVQSLLQVRTQVIYRDLPTETIIKVYTKTWSMTMDCMILPTNPKGQHHFLSLLYIYSGAIFITSLKGLNFITVRVLLALFAMGAGVRLQCQQKTYERK